MESSNLTDEQRLYLQAIFDYFREYGKWPSHTYLERQFIHTHPDLDIEEIAQSLPGGLTSPVELWNADSKATLTVPAIYQCWGSVQELNTFVCVIEICVETYFNSGGEMQSLSSADLARNNPTWRDIAIRKVGLLLLGETSTWSTFAGPDNEGGWSCVIAKGIRRFRGVKTIEQYLEKRNIPTKVTSQPIIPDIEVPIVVPANDIQLHPDILSRCWDLYITQKYDDAILNATKAVEVAVRTKANLPQNCVGVDVINTAFSPKKPLLLYSKVDAEQEGIMSLLRGIIQVFKNPQSHRFVGVQSKSECLGVLLMCSNLLYVVDNASYVGK
jgi:uncharacterized protein (TIGR02391 family)